MKREHIIIIAQYLLVWILTILLTVYIFPEFWFFNFITTYWRYILIFTCSYITYYQFQTYQEKKYQQIRQGVLYFNIYLFAHVFFRPLLNITPELFILLGVSITVIFSLQKLFLNTYIKTSLTILLSIINILILISGLIYTYPEPPHINQFIQKQSLQLITSSPENTPPQQTYLKIYYPENSREEMLLFQEGTFQKILPNHIELHLISNQQNIPQQTFLLFPNWSLLQLLPQSTIAIKKEGLNHIIQQWIGNSKIFNSELDTTIMFQDQQNISPEIYHSISQQYYNNLQTFLKKQIWGVFRTNPISIRLSEKTLLILSKTLPSFFSQNLKNFYNFQTFFQEDTTTSTFSEKYSNPLTSSTQNSLWSSLLQNIKLGITNTSSHKTF